MSADDTVAFLEVAKAGGFTAAARQLKQPKTNLVRRVRALEDRLGVRLFDRTTRSLALTEAGRIYRSHFDNWAEALNSAEEAVADLRARPAGWVRISMPHSLAGLITPLLAEFGTFHPEIRFDLKLSHQVADLIAGDIDVALRLGPLHNSSLVGKLLTVLPNRIYAAPAYLERRGAPKSPEELVVHDTLTNRLAERHGRYAWEMRTDGALRDYPIDPVMVADDPSALLAALEAGRGVMLATDAVVAPLVARGAVLPVMAPWLGRSPQLHAVFPAGKVLLLKTRLVIDFLADRLKRLKQHGPQGSELW